MCGATDCPSCGPAQGYDVIQVRDKKGRLVWRNPEDLDEGEVPDDPDARADFEAERRRSWEEE
jgi:hypothetical protein